MSKARVDTVTTKAGTRCYLKVYYDQNEDLLEYIRCKYRVKIPGYNMNFRQNMLFYRIVCIVVYVRKGNSQLDNESANIEITITSFICANLVILLL